MSASDVERWTIWWTGDGSGERRDQNRHAQVSGPHVPLTDGGVEVVRADAYDQLAAYAKAAADQLRRQNQELSELRAARDGRQ